MSRLLPLPTRVSANFDERTAQRIGRIQRLLWRVAMATGVAWMYSDDAGARRGVGSSLQTGSSKDASTHHSALLRLQGLLGLAHTDSHLLHRCYGSVQRRVSGTVLNTQSCWRFWRPVYRLVLCVVCRIHFTWHVYAHYLVESVMRVCAGPVTRTNYDIKCFIKL